MPRTPLAHLGWAALAILAAAGHAHAQQDVQITSEQINRVCAERYANQNVQAEAPTIRGPQDVTLNCRVINANGPTVAQFTPGEVCQRLTGSTDWYRGMGTQVYCRMAAGTPAEPKPRSFTINEDDIAKACQQTHRNPQATAMPTTAGPYGLEFNCRLVNQNGTTLARVSPEEICASKFGSREYMRVMGSNTIVCKGTPTQLGEGDRAPNKGGGGGGGGGAGSGGVNDVPLTAEALTQGCRALHGADATAGPLVRAEVRLEATVSCTSAGGRTTYDLPQFCPHVSGTSGWYITDFGRGTFMPGEATGTAPRLHVCRGPGPLQYHALADIGRYCRNKGHRWGHYGSVGVGAGTGPAASPACWDEAPGYRTVPTYITMTDVCRDVHGGSAFEARGMAYLCVPTGAPPAQPAANATPTTQPCPDCAPLSEAITRFEQQIRDQDKRLADEEAYRRAQQQEAQARGLTSQQKDGLQQAERASAARIEGIKTLQAQMKAALEDRKTQLRERLSRCTEAGCRDVIAGIRPDLVPPIAAKPPTPPPQLPPTTERQPPQPPTTERRPSPPPAQTPDTPRTTERPAEPSTPPTTERQPTTPPTQTAKADPAASDPRRSRQCPGHEAELTNSNRIFHRLYVLGIPKTDTEEKEWVKHTTNLRAALEGPNRQHHAYSTSKTMDRPSVAEFTEEMKRLHKAALPCHEVTLFIHGHGSVAERHLEEGDAEKTGEKRPEYVGIDAAGLYDTELGDLVRGFQPGVSVTVIMFTCYGGGFAGKGNVEESRLVQLIGTATVCTSYDTSWRAGPLLSEAITKSIDDRIAKNGLTRVTARDVKGDLLRNNWPLGQPFDDQATDDFMDKNLKRPDQRQ
jgi:hypothetical protein